MARSKLIIRPVALLLLCALLAVCALLGFGIRKAFTKKPGPVVSAPPISTAPQAQVPDNYTYITPESSQLARGPLILVNESAACSFAQEDTLVSLYEHKAGTYAVRDKLLLLQEDMIPALDALMQGLKEEIPEHTVSVFAGYRTSQEQQDVYDSAVKRSGEDAAKKMVSAATKSDYHTGYSVDFKLVDPQGASENFTGEGDYAWVPQNAPKYGFVLRYPEGKEDRTGLDYRSDHYRYVGLPHSLIMQENSFTLEEYIDYLKAYPFEGTHLSYEADGRQYEIYYAAAGTAGSIPVPSDTQNYAISGNNIDGYIVTVTR
jgi:LAS superfamily LD-carboxypeptidase LdcB